MRILAISNFYPPLIKGGLELSASIICRSLADAGHDVTVLTRRSDPEFEQVTPNLAVYRFFDHKYRMADISKWPKRLHGWFSIDVSFRNGSVNKPMLREFLKGKEFDVAICFSLQDIGTSLASELHRHGIPVVWSIADYWHIERKEIGLEGRLSRFKREVLHKSEVADELGYPFNNAIFISKYIQSEYGKHGIAPKNSFVINRSYAIPESVIPYDSSEREPIFMVACQLVKHKGVHLVIEAASALKETHGDREWRVEVFGGGETETIAELKAQIEDLGIGDRVKLRGKISHAEVAKHMQRSKAFIHAATWEEPFGRVAIESLANGVPLIAGRASAIQEIVESDGAFLYDRFSSADLADQMRKILDDPEACRRMAENGIKRHRDFFTPDKELAKIEGALAQIKF